MHEPQPVSYSGLGRLLQSADAASGAAEAHGLLCGIACTGGKVAGDVWLAHLLGEGNTLSAAARDCSAALLSLQQDIRRELRDDALGFMPLLPLDGESLGQRTRALSQWCEGFLYGMALGGIRADAPLPEDIAEILKDFYEISHAGFTSEGTDDADEAAYLEIVEYVRMCVLLVHEELRPAPDGTRLQ